MAKEWILNSAMNRYQLNYKRNVGPTSESIRKCSPKNLDQWRDYYFTNVRSKEHIIELGKRLYIKITEVIQAEVEDITEQDCIDYLMGLVIDRTYDGYTREISTIYGQLEKELGVKIEPAPDVWDRHFNVDFYIKVNEKYIGLQIKPINQGIQLSQIMKEKELQRASFREFKKKYGGEVFYVYSSKAGSNKIIMNLEVIEEIRGEIKRLIQEN
ncbi:MAG: MjaI family restriction endonuclease [Anaerolineaceae bacterium]